jgi:hypothetical protein
LLYGLCPSSCIVVDDNDDDDTEHYILSTGLFFNNKAKNTLNMYVAGN